MRLEDFWKSLSLMDLRTRSRLGVIFSRLKFRKINLVSVSIFSNHMLTSELWGYFFELMARCISEFHSFGWIFSPVENTIRSPLKRKWHWMAVGLLPFGWRKMNLGWGINIFFDFGAARRCRRRTGSPKKIARRVLLNARRNLPLDC